MLNFDKRALSDAFKNVCELTNTIITLFDDNQKPVFSYAAQPYSICQKIRAVPDLNDKCDGCNRSALEYVSKKRSVYIYKCHMGMTEAVLPVIQNSKIIGYIMLGKIIEFDDIPLFQKRISKYCKKYNLSEEELLSDANDVHRVTHEIVATCTNILNMLSSHLLLNNIITSSQNPSLITKINNYIRGNLNANLSVKSLCSHFKISKTTLYKVSVAGNGCGISEYIKNLRMEEAKRLLGYGLSVTQVAESVGLPDPNYFIKVFKRETGYTPLKYKKSLELKEQSQIF